METIRDRTDQKYPEKDSFLKNLGQLILFNNIQKLFIERFDDVRVLEMKEIQEEEMYINNLKRQREKV